MKRSMIGMLAATAVATVLGGAALAKVKPAAVHAEPHACFRTHCDGAKDQTGDCGTKFDGITTAKACKKAGGTWATEAQAAKFKKKS